ncbi:hypothetical protein [Rhodovulum sulfidophilum]|nr:hypothetical protein [Rhodovulum sulfidophilum]
MPEEKDITPIRRTGDTDQLINRILGFDPSANRPTGSGVAAP